MIDLDDKKYVVLKSGRKIPRYRATCNQCNADRGYKDKNKANKLCIMCANQNIAEKYLKGKTLKESTKRKMKISALNRKERVIRQKVEHNSWRTYITHNTPMQRKLKHNIKTLINQKLKSRKISKDNQRTSEILGYSIIDLKEHLESQFHDGMSWDNYGLHGWHIDHIKPDSLFNYKSIADKDFKKSWDLNNLQPLWAKDNLKKGNKYSE